jgi:hypothetical protein
MSKGRTIQLKETRITIITKNKSDLICLTDMTSGFNEGSGLIGK